MADFHTPDDFQEDLAPKSKSQRKRDMQALQDLGKQLSELRPDQLAQIPLDDDLRYALEQLQQIKSHEARRRQLQYLGKLMRGADTTAITQALAGLQAGSVENTRRLHLAEKWRDRLSSDGDTAVTDFLSHYPAAEAQHLRNLVRNARQDLEKGQNRGHGRKLFRHIRTLIDDAEQSAQ